MADAVTDPAAAAAIAAMLKEAAYFIRGAQIFFCAIYAVCLWDWLISLQREYHLIWKSKWSIIKVLYLMCRYYVIIVMPYVLWVFIEDHTMATCLKIFRSPIALAMMNQLFSEAVLLVRTYAFLGNKLPVLVFLIACLSGVFGYQLYVDLNQMSVVPFLDPTGGPCFPTTTHPGSPHVMAFFLASLLFDLIVTGLTVWRAFQLRVQSGGARSPLLKTFVTEGIYYFILISCANLVNAIFYWQPRAVMSALLVPLSVMLPDVLACRMILGLRERGIRHTSGNHVPSNGAGATYTHTARKLSVANKLNTAAAGTMGTGRGGDSKDGGAITNMGFNTHELTTFQRGGDSESMVDDIKSVPLEMDDGSTAHTGRRPKTAEGAIRVDIESHQYYEQASDEEQAYAKKGRSFMS